MLRTCLSAILCLIGPLGAQTSLPFQGPGFPTSIGPNLQGLLIFCSTDFGGNEWVGYLAPNGSLIDTVSIGQTQGLANGVATDGGTVVFVVDRPFSGTGNGEVDVYDLDGAYLQSFPVPTPTPTGIAYNFITGTILVTDANTVYEFEFLSGPIGTLLSTTPLPGTVGVTGIAWDVVSDTYWIRDDAGDELRRYDLAFNLLSTTPFVWPPGDTQGLAFFDNTQSVYMVEPFNGLEVVVVGVASADSFGVGCGAQPLTLDVTPPQFGTTMSMTLSNVPANWFDHALLFGVTAPNLPLDAIGAPGCVLRSGAEITTVFTQVPQLDVPIPPTSTDLIGVFLFVQGAVIDVAGGLTTSNGVRLTVGTI